MSFWSAAIESIADMTELQHRTPKASKTKETLPYVIASPARAWQSIVAVFCIALFLAFPSFAADKMDRYDSTQASTLNMTEEQIAEVYGVDSSKLAQGPTLQELNEEDPKYIKRDYDHKQQVVVGSVIMLCVALAMVLMNNYNPKR